MPDARVEEVINDDDKTIGPKWLWIALCLSFIIIIGIGFDGYVKAGTAERMGQWGDFFGGTLNPILSFLTFSGLIYTILLQRNELDLSRQELKLTRLELSRSSVALEDQSKSLKQQRFESAFFGMVGVFNNIVENMDVILKRGGRSEDQGYSGRDCFVAFVEELDVCYVHRLYNSEPTYDHDRTTGRSVLIEYPHDLERIISSYEHFYKKRASDLAHYFRVLYNIFRYVEESGYAEGVYAKILRAQLSDQELIILYYNCYSAGGKNFLKYAKMFKVFDNLDRDKLIFADHSKIFGDDIFDS